MGGVCGVCGASGGLTAEALGLCPRCARSEDGLGHAHAAHARSKGAFGLPGTPPRTRRGIPCGECGSRCVLGEGESGFCGLRVVRDGELQRLAGTPDRGILQWYRDPLPTNCVADWVCPGSRRAGMHNLAVFYASCTLDCLFCQNWHWRQADPVRGRGTSARELADAANEETFCVCYFGGDPASQMAHALASAEILAERGITVCWETAGTARRDRMDRALELSLESGGCVKFDLKAFTGPLHVALTGVGNERTLSNFARAAHRFRERPSPPPVVASTLLVPGYVDAEEVARIAAFVASHDPAIPYSLLAFAPRYLMSDLPCTSRDHAEEARRAALDAGLLNVRIANRHLLGAAY